jgi:PAS domain S-box-containing protein
MKRGSLQQRLLVVMLVSAIPVFALHVTVQIISDVRTARTRATTNTQDIAAAAIPLLQSTLIVGDLATTQETLDNIMRHGQFRRLRLLDQTGKKALAEGRPGAAAESGEVPDWFLDRLDFRFEPQQFPIVVGGTTYGTLQAEPSSMFLVVDVWQRLWTAVGLWLVTVGFLVSLLKITLVRGLRPLDDLAEAAHRFGGGDLNTRAPISDVPELAETAGAFNRMAENLAEARDRLETRVRQRTAELSASEARTSAILRNLLDGVAQIDTQGLILTVNEAVCVLFGYREAELLGQNIKMLVAEPSGSGAEGFLARYLAAPQATLPGSRHEVEGRRKDGSLFSLDITANELAYDSVRSYICVLRDISQQKAAEAAREAARTNAVRLTQAKSEFIANMSHEIRTPLNAILGFAQVGIRKSQGQQVTETFERILRSGELLLRLINDILDFSKIEAQKLQVEAVPFDLGEVIDRALDLNAASAYGKGLRFTVSEAADLPARCIGDPIRVAQVLVNLLSNAIKFTETGGVSLDVQRAGTALLFRVSDTGIGISADHMTRLFEPFEQADSSTTRRFGGTGLGLVISRRLVALMGGEIRVDSQPGVGTTIEMTLTLPEVAGHASAPASRPIRLHGLPPDEGGALARALAERGIAVTLATTSVLSEVPNHGLLVADAMAIAKQSEAARAFVLRGQALAIVYTPGLENPIPDDLAAHSLHLDRPLRCRLLIAPRAGQAEDPVARQATAKTPRLAGIRILAAEDDAASRLVLKEIVELEGASLVVEENGAAACDRLIKVGPGVFDIVITDIQMPRLDGYATTRRILEIAPGLPVIGLSAHAMPEEWERCLAAGMVDLVTKPVAIDALVAAILPQLRGHGVAVGAGHPDGDPKEVVRAAMPSLIDWSALEARFNGNRSFVAQLAEAVLESHVETPAQLRVAAADFEYPAMASLSHKTRGMAVNMMIEPLQELAGQAEQAARAEQLEAQELAGRLADALDAVLAAMTAGTGNEASSPRG